MSSAQIDIQLIAMLVALACAIPGTFLVLRKMAMISDAISHSILPGIVLGFLAIVAILNNDRAAAFLWLGLARLVDGIDGTLARKAKVNENIPNIDGSTLDNIVDYFTYVIIPALMIYWFGLVPKGWEIITSTAILAASLYTFANIKQK